MSLKRGVGGSKKSKTPLRNVKMLPNNSIQTYFFMLGNLLSQNFMLKSNFFWYEVTGVYVMPVLKIREYYVQYLQDIVESQSAPENYLVQAV